MPTLDSTVARLASDRTRALCDEPLLRACDAESWPAGAGAEERLDLLRRGASALARAWSQEAPERPFPWATLWRFWLPQALVLAQRQRVGRPVIQGVLGSQGIGKTTLGRMLTPLLGLLGRSSLCLSLDDFYRTAEERRALGRRDPSLARRGPPGTHDVALAIRVLSDLRAGRPVSVPRFDKSLQGGAGDRSGFQEVPGVDVVLFEGWMVGCRPVPAGDLDSAGWPIVTDADRRFARACNERLSGYVPLWELLDSLILMYLPDFREGQAWRREAERRTRAAGRAGMADGEVDAFVETFWKALHPDLFLRPLAGTSGAVERVIEWERDRRIRAIYLPGARNPGGHG